MKDLNEEDLEDYLKELEKSVGDLKVKKININAENLDEEIQKLMNEEDIATLFDLDD